MLMMGLSSFGNCFDLSSQNPFRQNERPLFVPQGFVLTPMAESPLVQKQKQNLSNNSQIGKAPICLSKRSFGLSVVGVILSGPLISISTVMGTEEMKLERYTDVNEGFTLLRPSSWIQVDKAGATALFEGNNGSNNVGVVVSPVRLNKLGDFGSPQFVAEKLIQAEKRKESTRDAEVIGVAERSGMGGLQVYEFEYKIDSTRGGIKRIFSAAFVASKKLYLLNIAHSDRPENPLDIHTRTILEQVLHSFDVVVPSM